MLIKALILFRNWCFFILKFIKIGGKIMKKLVKFLMAMVVIGLFAACGGEKESAKPAADKVYVIGTNAEYPPFEYLEDGQVCGLDADIIAAAAEKMGIKYKWSNMNFDGLIPALQTKKVNAVIAGMSITPERSKAVNFSMPYLTSNVAFIANKNNPINGAEELEGKNYGAELGTTKEAVARKIKGATVTPFSSNTGALVALKSGKIDGIVLDESVGIEFVKNNPELMMAAVLEGEPKAIAFNKDDNELKEKFDKALKELIEDGTIQKLREKYGV